MRTDTRTPVAESQWDQLSLSCFQSLSQWSLFHLCGNQPVRRVYRQFFTKSFIGNDAVVLAPSSGEEAASPRHRAGVASMAWRTTR